MPGTVIAFYWVAQCKTTFIWLSLVFWQNSKNLRCSKFHSSAFTSPTRITRIPMSSLYYFDSKKRWLLRCMLSPRLDWKLWQVAALLILGVFGVKGVGEAWSNFALCNFCKNLIGFTKIRDAIKILISSLRALPFIIFSEKCGSGSASSVNIGVCVYIVSYLFQTSNLLQCKKSNKLVQFINVRKW